jgi:hypothetical protein
MISMAIHEPERITPAQKRKVRTMYIAIFVASTVVVTVALSVLGYINLSPVAALVAGTIAGFAFVMFHLTYLRFVGNAAYRIHGQEDGLE